MSARKIISGSYRNDTPLLRMLIFYVAGIIVQINTTLDHTGFFIFFFILLIWLTLNTLKAKGKNKWKWRWTPGFALLVLFFIAGLVITSIQTEINDPRHFQFQKTSGHVFFARIITPLTEKPGSYKTTVEFYAIRRNITEKKVTGKVLVYFKKDSLSAQLKYGDLFCFNVFPEFVSGPENPGEFNYQRFLAFHQIYHQVYLAGKNWKALNKNEGHPVIVFAYAARNYFCEILRSQISDQRDFSVASALVIGYIDEVDKELINAYASAGALHVLSVSGMHVGLIYQGLFLLLGFMNKKIWSRHLFHAFLLTFIWFYAFLTGFSPSVARAAVMLSIVITGRWFGGTTNVLNTLVVSAFGLLLYNPFYLTEVGFQLSFLAVWGIISLHPRIFQLIEPSGRLLHWVWEITSISFAAQLMTFPLGLFYFHQFPNFFMIANLIVIPLSGFIIYACLALLVCSPVLLISGPISKITGFLLSILNESVLWIDGLPGAVLSGIHITGYETMLIYLLLIGVGMYILDRRPASLFAILTFLVILVTLQLYEKYEQLRQKQIIVYNISGRHAMDLVYGRNHLFISDSTVVKNQAGMQFHINSHWWRLGLNQTTYLNKKAIHGSPIVTDADIWIYNHFIFFAGKRILLTDKKFIARFSKSKPESFSKIMIDYLILSDNALWHINDLLLVFDCKLLIIDSSNSKNFAERWVNEAKILNVKCYSVSEQGAFIEKINQSSNF